MPQLVEEKKLYSIKGVEIFAAGTWNKKNYGIGALHEIASSFSALKPGWIPSLKLGHDREQKVAKASGLPSVGYVERVYVIGDKLLADFEHIPEKVFKAIKQKAYRKVSCELYHDVSVNGSTYPHVLSAVAFLGNELPGVTNLNELLDQYSHLETGEVFAILQKQDTFESHSQTFELENAEVLPMPKTENELKLEAEIAAQKESFSALQAEKAALETAKAELEQFKKDAAARETQLALEKADAQRAAFVADLKGKKLLTNATEKMVGQLLSDKSEFSIDEKPATKNELIEKVLTLTAEAAKVNFDESSLAEFAKKGDEDEADKQDKKIKAYQEENKCSYQSAYKAVMKNSK